MHSLAKIFSALALAATLGGCGSSEMGPWNAAKCVFDSRCDPFPGTPHHPVVESDAGQNTTP